MLTDTELFAWLEQTGYSLVSDTYAGARVWACFECYPDKPETTANPFPMYDTPQNAVRAAMERDLIKAYAKAGS